MNPLEGKLVVLGVTGGIAAYRSCELARLLVKQGARVQAVLTDYAAKLVGPLTFQALTGRPAEVGQGGLLAQAGMDHIELGSEAAAIVIAPATANTLAKLSVGLADNLLTTTVLASRCPIILAPAMNTRMWQNPVTEENVRRLLALERFHLVGPEDGSLACGEEGPGRMAEPAVILQSIQKALTSQDLRGRRVLVTAGPTREAVDPVRYLSNRSSGKMGYAMAERAWMRGAEVVLVTGPTSLPAPPGVEVDRVVTAADMAAIVLDRAAEADLVLMAAAVADFRPKALSRTKIKKSQGVPCLELEPTEDILASLGARKDKAVLIGFAAETGDPLEAARNKLLAKGLDLVVANDVSAPAAGFEVDTNLAHLVSAEGIEALPLMTKHALADRILDRARELLERRG